MRRILFVLALAFCAVTSFAASTVSQAKFVITAIPNDGDTFVYRGVTRTWKSTVTASGTQVQIGGSITISANNMAAQIGQYPLDTVSHLVQESVTNLTMVADADISVTASRTGTWGTVTVTSSTLTQGPLLLPLVTESTLTRTNDANNLISAFNYASTAFAANVAAISNYVNTTLAQTISGAKMFTGANTYSNAAQLFTGGTISNVALTNIPAASVTNLYVKTYAYFNGGLEITNISPSVRYYDTTGGANQKRTWVKAAADGFNIFFYNDAISAQSNVFSIDRDSTYGALEAVFRTRLTADSIYNTVISNSVTTNMQMIHAVAAMIAEPMFLGPVAISNTAPILTLNELDAGSNLKQFQYRSEAGVLTLYMASDAGAVASNQKVWSIERPGLSQFTADSRFHVFSPTVFDSSVGFTGADIDVTGTLSAGNGLISGSITETLPGGQLGGLYILDGTAPFADPLTSGSTMWSESGQLKYRTSGASEGSGQENHVHNRTGSVFGAGTDYPLTTSMAFVDFGTTDPKVTLPTSGTYLIWAELAVTEDGGTANDEIRAKLRNETASADLSGSDQSISYLPAGKLGTIKMQATVTANASDVIAIWAHNNSGSARGTANSARTRIGYVRLY